MKNLFLSRVIDLHPYYKNKIKKIVYDNKIYYELIITSATENDKVYFETHPNICNKCNISLSIYKDIYVNYLFILKKHLNSYVYDKLLKKIKKFHNVKCESDLIGTRTYWYIHLCHKCYNH